MPLEKTNITARLNEYEHADVDRLLREDPPIKEYVAKPKVLTTEEILEERGKEYGEFEHHAIITQGLERDFYTFGKSFNSKRISTLNPSAKEAIHMIFHKLGRICNGNPENVDSWDDIAGYAKLEADRLRKKADF